MGVNKNIRLLKANEIDCRVAQISEKGLSLLLYKDARVDQKILDETFTIFGWRRHHESIDGNLYCTVEIYDENKKEWISKQDVGTESYSDKEKGQASDAFKRACVNFGIGRELYTAPFIWISAKDCTIKKRDDGKFYTSEKFKVTSISYNDEREIVGLTITNSGNKIVYSFGESTAGVLQIADAQMVLFNRELERTGVGMDKILARYKLKDESEINQELFTSIMKDLRSTKTKAA